MIKIIGCQVHQHFSIVANLCELFLLLSMLVWERLQQLFYNTFEAILATWPFTQHKPHHNSSLSSAQHLSRPDFQTPRTQSRLATNRSPRFGPQRTHYLCLSLQETKMMWLKKLKQNVSKLSLLTFLCLHRHHHVLNFLVPQQRMLQFINLAILQRVHRPTQHEVHDKNI